MRISNGLSCTKDIIHDIGNHIRLTKNGLDAVKVPEEALVSETADDAVKLNNNRKEQSEKELPFKSEPAACLSIRNDQTKLVGQGVTPYTPLSEEDICRLLLII